MTPNPSDGLSYYRREPDGQWLGEDITGVSSSLDLAVGSDGQPRVSRHMMPDLRLYTREILWLEHHALLPVVPR